MFSLISKPSIAKNDFLEKINGDKENQSKT